MKTAKQCQEANSPASPKGQKKESTISVGMKGAAKEAGKTWGPDEEHRKKGEIRDKKNSTSNSKGQSANTQKEKEAG